MGKKKNRQIFYDFQLVRDIDSFGLEANPNDGFDNEEKTINAIKKCLSGFDYGEEDIDVLIYKVQIIKTVTVSIKNKKIVKIS